MSLRALLYRRPSEPSVVQVVFDKAIYLVRLRRHRQARRYTLRIDAPTREVVLTMPPRGSVREAKEFAQKHGGWIAARLKRLPEATPFVARASRCRCAACPIASCIGAASAARCGQRPTGAANGCSASRASRRMSIAASATFSSARRQRGSMPPAAVTPLRSASRSSASAVRDQSSRWGSCSNTGVLSFSWRLILAPPFVLDYLAAHEVSHLVEPITRGGSGGW